MTIPSGTVYRTGKAPDYAIFRKSTLTEYKTTETAVPVITHVQIDNDGTEWHFLQSYGLTSWVIKAAR